VSRGSRPNTLPCRCLQIDTNDSTLVAEDFLRRKEKARKRARQRGRETSGVATGSADNIRYHLSLDVPARCRDLTSQVFVNGKERKKTRRWELALAGKCAHPLSRHPRGAQMLRVSDRCEASGAMSFFLYRTASITVCRKTTSTTARSILFPASGNLKERPAVIF